MRLRDKLEKEALQLFAIYGELIIKKKSIDEKIVAVEHRLGTINQLLSSIEEDKQENKNEQGSK